MTSRRSLEDTKVELTRRVYCSVRDTKYVSRKGPGPRAHLFSRGGDLAAAEDGAAN